MNSAIGGKAFLSEAEREAERNWVLRMLENKTLPPEKTEAFGQILADINKSRIRAVGAAADSVHPYGSPWTILAKIVCVVLVIAAMFGGGEIARYLSDDEGVWVFGGGCIGILIGLVIVSGIMIWVQIADDVADARLYLKNIYEILQADTKDDREKE